MSAPTRWRAQERMLHRAAKKFGTRDELEQQGMLFMGSIRAAAAAGYFTEYECEKEGCPATKKELSKPRHFAMMADHSTKDEMGNQFIPCLPVFYRRR